MSKTLYWYQDTELEHTDAVNDLRSTEQGCHNGKLHREDGPALVWADGTEMWYHHGKRHRLDGPAVVYPDGTEMWFLDGVRVTKDQAMNPYKEDTTK